jgi:hypothetical protein
MKKNIYIILLTVLLTGCKTYTGAYKLGLLEVDRPENIESQYSETKITDFQDRGVTKYCFEDSLIKIIWLPLNTRFSFSLINKTKHSIKIIWDNALYINENGTSQKVFHYGVKYSDRNNSQPPTTVSKGSRIDDLIMPTDNVYFSSGQYGSWRESPLFKNSASTPEELEAIKSSYIGKVVKIILPLKIEDLKSNYLFTFKIEDFKAK